MLPYLGVNGRGLATLGRAAELAVQLSGLHKSFLPLDPFVTKLEARGFGTLPANMFLL